MLLWYLERILQNSLIKITKSDQIKILNDKIKVNNSQYKIDRLNAEISAFSEGDLDKYEFLTRKCLKYKPNALHKAKFEFSPLGKAFNQGLDKKAEKYKEEGIIKLLKDIRDKMVRPIGGNNDNRNNSGNNDDHDDNNDNDDNDDEYLLKLDRLLKGLKDDKKFLGTFNKDIDDKSNEELKAEELERRLKKLINKKHFELFREYLKESEDANPQGRVDALRKRLNNLPKTNSDETSDKTSDETSDDNEDKSDDSEDNQISNFADRALKKVSEEIVNDDDNENDDNKKLLKLSKENVDLKSKVDVLEKN